MNHILPKGQYAIPLCNELQFHRLRTTTEPVFWLIPGQKQKWGVYHVFEDENNTVRLGERIASMPPGLKLMNAFVSCSGGFYGYLCIEDCMVGSPRQRWQRVHSYNISCAIFSKAATAYNTLQEFGLFGTLRKIYFTPLNSKSCPVIKCIPPRLDHYSFFYFNRDDLANLGHYFWDHGAQKYIKVPHIYTDIPHRVVYMGEDEMLVCTSEADQTWNRLLLDQALFLRAFEISENIELLMERLLCHILTKYLSGSLVYHEALVDSQQPCVTLVRRHIAKKIDFEVPYDFPEDQGEHLEYYDVWDPFSPAPGFPIFYLCRDDPGRTGVYDMDLVTQRLVRHPSMLDGQNIQYHMVVNPDSPDYVWICLNDRPVGSFDQWWSFIPQGCEFALPTFQKLEDFEKHWVPSLRRMAVDHQKNQ